MYLNKKEIKLLEEILPHTDLDFNEKGETNKWDSIVEELIYEYFDLKEEFEDYKNRIEYGEDYDER